MPDEITTYVSRYAPELDPDPEKGEREAETDARLAQCGYGAPVRDHVAKSSIARQRQPAAPRGCGTRFSRLARQAARRPRVPS